jgi:hypothetical protein
MRHKVTTELRYPSLWRGCVGAWNPGLGPTGLTLRDWSPYRNHGTLTNMDAGADWVSSQGRYALDFDGSNDYVATASRDLGFGNNASVFFWVRPISSSGSTKVLVGYHGVNLGGYDSSGWLLNYISGNVSVYWKSGGPVFNTTTAPVLGVWQHIGFINRNGIMTAFLNGVANGTGTSGGSISGANLICLAGAGGFAANIQLDDVVIHNRVLSLTEIRLLASRRGIAYELAPRRRSSVAVAGGGFKAAWIPRRSLIIGGGTN